MTSAEWIPVIVDRIVERFQPLRVILFGSHARGQARPDSDVDLLVVLAQCSNSRAATIAILRELSDLLAPTDILVTTPEEIERRGQVIGSVLRPALREGRVVYEQARPSR